MPENHPSQSVPELLHELRSGNKAAGDALFSRVYADLRHRARRVRRAGTPATLNTTALVHEAYLHLRPGSGLDVESRAHFLHLAARAMRQVIARAIRHRNADKRGGGAETLSFQEHMKGERIPLDDLVSLEDALAALEHMHERQARVVECRFYAGLTVVETARALDISSATVKRDWRAARAFLLSRLQSLG